MLIDHDHFLPCSSLIVIHSLFHSTQIDAIKKNSPNKLSDKHRRISCLNENVKKKHYFIFVIPRSSLKNSTHINTTET
jgi:hypothetical protein